MTERKVEITSLKLKLGKTEATLTVDEARKLKKVLEDIFGVREVERIVSNPFCIDPYPMRPYWVYPGVTWADNGASCTMDNHQLTCVIKDGQ